MTDSMTGTAMSIGRYRALDELLRAATDPRLQVKWEDSAGVYVVRESHRTKDKDEEGRPVFRQRELGRFSRVAQIADLFDIGPNGELPDSPGNPWARPAPRRRRRAQR